jgi:hypothetical protein
MSKGKDAVLQDGQNPTGRGATGRAEPYRTRREELDIIQRNEHTKKEQRTKKELIWHE